MVFITPKSAVIFVFFKWWRALYSVMTSGCLVFSLDCVCWLFPSDCVTQLCLEGVLWSSRVKPCGLIRVSPTGSRILLAVPCIEFVEPVAPRLPWLNRLHPWNFVFFLFTVYCAEIVGSVGLRFPGWVRYTCRKSSLVENLEQCHHRWILWKHIFIADYLYYEPWRIAACVLVEPDLSVEGGLLGKVPNVAQRYGSGSPPAWQPSATVLGNLLLQTGGDSGVQRKSRHRPGHVRLGQVTRPFRARATYRPLPGCSGAIT